MNFCRKALIILCANLIFGFWAYSAAWCNAPEWYRQQTVPAQAYEMIGYGQGKSLLEAKSNAQQDIAGQIYTEVQSEFVSQKFVTSPDNFQAQQRARLIASSRAVLTDLETVKAEKSGKRYFVALQYNVLPLEKRAAAILGRNLCNPKPLPRLLKASEFAKRVSDTLGCSIYVEIQKTGNTMRLYANGQSITLRPGEFQNFLPDSVAAESVSINTPRRVLRENDTYYLSVTAHKKGYLSLFSVDERGQVFKLIENRRVEVSERLIYPDPEQYEGLEALVSDGLDAGRDLFVAVITSRMASFKPFIEISDKLEETAYEFDRFVNHLDPYEFGAIAVRVVKKRK